MDKSRAALRSVDPLLPDISHNPLAQLAHKSHHLAGAAAELPVTVVGIILKANNEPALPKMGERLAHLRLLSCREGIQNISVY